MLNVLGSAKRLCDGLTRRDMLQAGGLGMLGLSLEQYLRLQSVQAETGPGGSFGRAKSCILLYLYGSPSQLELADLKPEAPVEIRGELGGIPSSLPGLDVCELMPNAAKIMDRMTVVRSVTHPHPIHGVAFALTGIPTIEVSMELSPRHPAHHPYMGSVVDYLDRQQRSGLAQAVPRHVAMPFPFSSQREGEVPRAGLNAAFLGGAYDPVWTEFQGQATSSIFKKLGARERDVFDPYMGITPDSRLSISAATEMPAELSLDRLDRRRSLLTQFDEARRRQDAIVASSGYDRFREMAYGLISSPAVSTALDVARETPQMRDLYGMTLFGQCSLAARRLVEAGSKFVTVVWDEYGLAGMGWDTHWNHYERMRRELMPGFERALYGLITDLDQRGMLDETLVLVLSEHGRTPQINKAGGGGRDHWSKCYSVLMAGGGVKRGNIVGRSDRIAGEVADQPVSPKDILATAYHCLGIDPETILYDRTNRPLKLVDAEVIPEILA